MLASRIPGDRHQEQACYGSSGGVDHHRELLLAVLAQQRGGEGQERDRHQEQKVEPEQRTVVAPYGSEDPVVCLPVYAYHKEADLVTKELRPQGGYAARKLLRHQVGRYLGHPYIEDEQRDDDGEDRSE